MSVAVSQLQISSKDLVQQGAAALRAQRIDEARVAFEQALRLDRDCVEAYLALSRLRFPGEFYLDILSRIHRAMRPRTYVEIGVGNGASLRRVQPATLGVGVDPNPNIAGDTPPNIRLLRMKSEDLFMNADPCALMGFGAIDLGFVDGMHLFENVLSDFTYLEQHASPGGAILIHDCLPFDALTSTRSRQTRFWTGDVWRVLPTLAYFRPDLRISVVACAPSGLGIIRNLNPGISQDGSPRDAMLAFGHALAECPPLSDHGIDVLPSDWRRIEPLFNNFERP